MKYPSLQTIDGAKPGDTLAILAPGNVEDMLAYSRAYKERGISYIFDPGQQIPALGGENIAEIVNGSRMLISNDYEIEMIMRSTNLSKSDLLERTECIITTLGDKGSVVITKEEQVDIPVAPADAVLDPTGAGDAYRAGLIKGLVTGKSLVESARMGSVNASFSVACQGTQCHRFTEEDFWTRYTAQFGAG
jgi:adenosine kinase